MDDQNMCILAASNGPASVAHVTFLRTQRGASHIMQAVPKFEVYDNGDTSDGFFKWGPARDELFETYYEASDQFYNGEIEEAKELLEEIIEKGRHFIEDDESQNIRDEIRDELRKIKQRITQASSKKILNEWKKDSPGAAYNK